MVHSLRFYKSKEAQATSVEEQMVLLLAPNTSSLSEHLSDRWAQDPGPSELISSTPPLKGAAERPGSASTVPARP